LYISTHRYEFGNFWPNLLESDFDAIGEGDGKGYNVNIPLNKVKERIFCTQFEDLYLDWIEKCGLYVHIF